MCSGSTPADIEVKPTRSAIRTVARRRSSSEAPMRWPHSWQNRAPAAVVAPQAGQVMQATLPVGSDNSVGFGRMLVIQIMRAHADRSLGKFRGRQTHGAHAAEGT